MSDRAVERTHGDGDGVGDAFDDDGNVTRFVGPVAELTHLILPPATNGAVLQRCAPMGHGVGKAYDPVERRYRLRRRLVRPTHDLAVGENGTHIPLRPSDRDGPSNLRHGLGAHTRSIVQARAPAPARDGTIVDEGAGVARPPCRDPRRRGDARHGDGPLRLVDPEHRRIQPAPTTHAARDQRTVCLKVQDECAGSAKTRNGPGLGLETIPAHGAATGAEGAGSDRTRKQAVDEAQQYGVPSSARAHVFESPITIELKLLPSPSSIGSPTGQVGSTGGSSPQPKTNAVTSTTHPRMKPTHILILRLNSAR
jgi:hypothetical protein